MVCIKNNENNKTIYIFQIYMETQEEPKKWTITWIIDSETRKAVGTFGPVIEIKEIEVPRYNIKIGFSSKNVWCRLGDNMSKIDNQYSNGRLIGLKVYGINKSMDIVEIAKTIEENILSIVPQK